MNVSVREGLIYCETRMQIDGSSGKPPVAFPALQKKAKEIHLTLGDWHPILAADQSFTDRNVHTSREGVKWGGVLFLAHGLRLFHTRTCA